MLQSKMKKKSIAELEALLRERISQAIFTLFDQVISPAEIVLQETRKEFKGDFTFVVFQLAGPGRSPEKAGEMIGEWLCSTMEEVMEFMVVKGFLNLSISHAYWLGAMEDLLDTDCAFDLKRDDQSEKILVEYCGPNTNKPLHVGHLRNILIGHSVTEIIKANGYEPVKVNMVNDRGIHICKSMLAWQKYGNGETPESSGIKGDHLVGKYYVLFDQHLKLEVETGIASGLSKEEATKNAPLMQEVQKMLRDWEAGNAAVHALWGQMNAWVYKGFQATYDQIGIDFQKEYFESQTWLKGKEMVMQGLANGVVIKKADGSLWIDLTADGLDEKVLLRADGTSVYITQDLGTAMLRYEDYHFDRMIYVVANEQDYHFKVLKLVLKKLGYAWADGIYHLSYGMVDLPGGRMKSREGTVVDADDLIEEMVGSARETTMALGKIDNFTGEQAEKLYHMIGMGAIKYFMLKVDPKKKMLFNPEESIDFNGHTGPFIQYTHARIQSLLNKAKGQGWNLEQKWKLDFVSASEKDLMVMLVNYQKVLMNALEAYHPAGIANYIYELAKLYNQFYHEYYILTEENKELVMFRLRLSEACGKLLKHGMNLLGIEVPDRM